LPTADLQREIGRAINRDGASDTIQNRPMTTRAKTSRTARPPGDATRRSSLALDLDVYIPAQLTYIAGKIQSGASAVYRPIYGVGITDWRIMALLASEPWIRATRICQATGLDKAAVSRSVRDMQEMALVEVHLDPADQRRQCIALTRKGLAHHDKIVHLARQREAHLLQDFSDEERRVLLDFLARLQTRVRTAAAITMDEETAADQAAAETEPADV
jgi:DNA-binding MarR family transcriptional regulator